MPKTRSDAYHQSAFSYGIIPSASPKNKPELPDIWLGAPVFYLLLLFVKMNQLTEREG